MIRLDYTPIPSDILTLGLIDAALFQGDLDSRQALATAVIISLFTDARAQADDALPAVADVQGLSGRRGWWGDLFPSVANDRIGSKLWLLTREKQTEETRTRALQYATEALQWLLEDGVASKVEVSAEWVRMGVLGLQIVITRPNGTGETFRYSNAWDELATTAALTKAEADALVPADPLEEENDGDLFTEDGLPIVL